MDQTALHLTDHVLPRRVPFRHWVVTFPAPLPVRLLYDPELRAQVLRIVVAVIKGYYRGAPTAWTKGKPEVGAVTSLGLSNGALEPFLHFHMLWVDGVFIAGAAQARPIFRRAPPLIDAELRRVVERIETRVLGLLARKGLLASDDELDGHTQAALSWVPRARPIRTHRRSRSVSPARSVSLCVRSDTGFTIHARTRIPAHDRPALVRLVRYLTRPPLAIHRLTMNEAGQVALRLPHPRRDGTVSLLYDPVDFIGLLAAIIPRPRSHLLHYHGVLAAGAKLRPLIIPAPNPTKRAPSPAQARSSSYIDWSTLLRRTFSVDVLHCGRCGRDRRILAVITDRRAALAILRHLGLLGPADVSIDTAPARAPPAIRWFDPDLPILDDAA